MRHGEAPQYETVVTTVWYDRQKDSWAGSAPGVTCDAETASRVLATLRWYGLPE